MRPVASLSSSSSNSSSFCKVHSEALSGSAQHSKYPQPISLLSNHNIQSRQRGTVFRWTFKGNYSTASLPSLPTECWKRLNKHQRHGMDRSPGKFQQVRTMSNNSERAFGQLVFIRLAICVLWVFSSGLNALQCVDETVNAGYSIKDTVITQYHKVIYVDI